MGLAKINKGDLNHYLSKDLNQFLKSHPFINTENSSDGDLFVPASKKVTSQDLSTGQIRKRESKEQMKNIKKFSPTIINKGSQKPAL